MPGPEIHEGEAGAYDADAPPPPASPSDGEQAGLEPARLTPSAAIASRLDEALEETFPASDPEAVKPVT